MALITVSVLLPTTHKGRDDRLTTDVRRIAYDFEKSVSGAIAANRDKERLDENANANEG